MKEAMQAMTINRWRRTSHRSSEAGQAILFVVLALGIFLLGAVALSVDISNLWFHRQAAQNAADAACTAGAMDLLVDAQGGATGHQGFAPGTGFSCSAGSSASPCQYAALNGYDGATGNQIDVSFPTTVPGVSSSVTPPGGMAPNAFMRVDVLDHVQTYFSGMLSGNATQDIRAFAVCGLVLAQSPIPLLVLDPQNPNVKPASSALNVQGTPLIQIVGGPSKSIQVNSQDPAAVNTPWGSATIDLSKGGPIVPPSTTGTGSDFGLYGGPGTAPTGFKGGTTGHWLSPSPPINDPFALMCAPGQTGCPNVNGNAPPGVPTSAPVPPPDGATITPACTSIPCSVPYHFHGCPDSSGCRLYEPGLYTSTISISGGGGITAIFDPGIYFIQTPSSPPNADALQLGSGSLVRPGTGPSASSAPGASTGGTFFYFQDPGTTTGTVTVAADSGSRVTGGTRVIDAFNTSTGPITSGATSAYSLGVACTSTSKVPSNISNVDLQGNILLGPCTGYYGDPLGTSDPIGVQRGFLFFQDRSGKSVQPSWGGGGQFLLAGTMYFHSCNASGTGVNCGAAGTYFNDVFSLSGNSGSGTYVLGDIVTDNLILGGTSGITMDLNPNVAFSIMKATLLR